MGVTHDRCLEAAAVDELNLGNISDSACCDMVIVLHIDVSAVAGIVLVVLAVEDIVGCIKSSFSVVFA